MDHRLLFPAPLTYSVPPLVPIALAFLHVTPRRAPNTEHLTAKQLVRQFSVGWRSGSIWDSKCKIRQLYNPSEINARTDNKTENKLLISKRKMLTYRTRLLAWSPPAHLPNCLSRIHTAYCLNDLVRNIINASLVVGRLPQLSILGTQTKYIITAKRQKYMMWAIENTMPSKCWIFMASFPDYVGVHKKTLIITVN